MTGQYPRLRSHSRKRKSGKVVVYYVYDRRPEGESDISLGTDFDEALAKWREIHEEKPRTIGTIEEGPERAERMNACASAIDAGVPFAIHSDAPVTPLAPLFTAWCAVNRRTAAGRVLGAAQCIGVGQALHAITLGAAYTLGLDAEIGSIEAGKRADFAVLNDDPLDCPPEALKDIGVWGVVQGGRVFPADRPPPAAGPQDGTRDIHS